MLKQALADLLTEGFALVPIVRGAKRPEHDGWLKRTFGPNDFTDNHNVGVKCGEPSGHKVDVDLDAKEAVAAADLLPITRVHGRPGKPHSHHWFLAPDLKQSLQFKDPISGDMLCELRGTGGQTVVPPSQHPSGEILTWENRVPFLPMAAADLERHVACIAVVALFARHWPGGSRHDASLHLGGFLARLGIDAPHIARMVRLIATIAGDEEVEDRARSARESAEKHARGDKTTGAPRLAEHFSNGAALVRAIYGWFGRDGDDAIEDLNSKHFVAQLGANMAVGEELPDQIIFQPFFAFQQRYCNQKIGKKEMGDAWLHHPSRRTYKRAVFAPPCSRWTAGPEDFNLWTGFAVEPDPNPRPEDRCRRYLEHIHEVICQGNQLHTDYVLDLLADTVQRPGRLVGKALAIRGKMGVGKSVFVEPFGWLFGQRHFTIVSSREQLVGAFNGHLSGKVVVLAEEAVWGGNKADSGTLKRLITQNTFMIRRLYMDAVNEPNCVHLFMVTNDKWVYPAGNDERRIVVLDAGPKRSPAYYTALFEEVEDTTFGPALLAYLLARPVNEARLRAGLQTEGLVELQDLSADPVQQWWHQVLEDGQLFSFQETWPDFGPLPAMYTRFLEDMGHRGAGAHLLGTRRSFAARLEALLPKPLEIARRRVKVDVSHSGSPVFVSQQQRGFVLPSLQICRDQFDKVTGLTRDWPTDDSASEENLLTDRL